MFKIEDGRESFYQWDLDRRIIVSDPTIDEVHFCNRTDSCSLVVEVYQENGISFANVPNILLQKDWKINVYGYCGKSYTKQSAAFKVFPRSKPADYIYTETEVITLDALERRIDEIEAKGLSEEAFNKAIGEYFEKNPIEVDLDDYYTKNEVDSNIEEVEKKIEEISIDIPRVEMTANDNIVSLAANIYYVFPEMTSLDISFSSEVDTGIVQEYKFRFTSGATATSLTLPSNVIGEIKVLENTVVEVSIIDGYMISQSWEVE